MISTVAMSLASSALVGWLSGADAGMQAAAGPLAVVNAGSDSARAAAQDALAHGMAVGVVICGCALLGALVTLLLVRGNVARSTTEAAVRPTARAADVETDMRGRISGPSFFPARRCRFGSVLFVGWV
ncbi:hypothetical protein [Streptomyces canus]|uniref:hypothetical protein n=1 Tax=Streptomyces canus TaxID=58343 RepID=UPI00277F2D7C|nr:hypothetical protein [Streptomyces canus]MDQ0758296.1 hypothetical protein [Streptomyces canus]MDQ1072947.1 hypothetical protein [Streptomyces canus]